MDNDKIIPVLAEDKVIDHFTKLLNSIGLSYDSDGLLKEMSNQEGEYEEVMTEDGKKLIFPIEKYLSKIQSNEKLVGAIPFNPVNDKQHKSRKNVLRFVINRTSNIFNLLLAVGGKLILKLIEEQEGISQKQTSKKSVTDMELIDIIDKFGPLITNVRKGSKLIKDYNKLIDKWIEVVVGETEDAENCVKTLGIISKEIISKNNTIDATAILTIDSPLYAKLHNNDQDNFEINGKKLSAKECKIFVLIFNILFPCFNKEQKSDEIVEQDYGRYSILSKSLDNPAYECLIKLLITTLPKIDRLFKLLGDHLDQTIQNYDYDHTSKKFEKSDLENMEQLNSYIIKRVEDYELLASNLNNKNGEEKMTSSREIYTQEPVNNTQGATMNNGFNGNVRVETELEKAERLYGNKQQIGNIHMVNNSQGKVSFFNNSNVYNPNENVQQTQHFVNTGAKTIQERDQIIQILANAGINPYERINIYGVNGNYIAIPTQRDANGNYYDQFGHYINGSDDNKVEIWRLSNKLHDEYGHTFNTNNGFINNIQVQPVQPTQHFNTVNVGLVQNANQFSTNINNDSPNKRFIPGENTGNNNTQKFVSVGMDNVNTFNKVKPNQPVQQKLSAFKDLPNHEKDRLKKEMEEFYKNGKAELIKQMDIHARKALDWERLFTMLHEVEDDYYEFCERFLRMVKEQVYDKFHQVALNAGMTETEFELFVEKYRERRYTFFALYKHKSSDEKTNPTGWILVRKDKVNKSNHSEKEYLVLKEEISRLEEKMNDLQEVIAELEDENSALKEEIVAKDEELIEKDEEIQKLEKSFYIDTGIPESNEVINAEVITEEKLSDKEALVINADVIINEGYELLCEDVARILNELRFLPTQIETVMTSIEQAFINRAKSMEKEKQTLKLETIPTRTDVENNVEENKDNPQH